jgi:hypothetical protein
MAPDLVVSIPSELARCANEVIPGNIPGKLGHVMTSTIASDIARSSGSDSPCFRALSM